MDTRESIWTGRSAEASQPSQVAMKTVVIVQARMRSTRLPGKVLREVLGKPLLSYMIERLRLMHRADELVIATSTAKEDDAIEALCKKEGVDCFRGSEDDVLSRYYKAAKKYGAELVVRLTADCPIIDWGLVDSIVGVVSQNPDKIDYMSNTLWRSYPRGMDVEVFKFDLLERAYNHATKAYDREHVTPYIRENTPRTRMTNYINAHGDVSWARLTVDTPEDFELIRRVIETLYPLNNYFTMGHVLELLEENPDWLKLNQDVEQK